MRTRSRKSAWSAIVIAFVMLAEATSVAAQPEPSDWVALEVPGLSDLAAPGKVASDGTGSAVLVGFSLGEPPRALAWSSPDGETWSAAELPGSTNSFALSVAGGPAGYVAVGRGEEDGRIWHSPTGETWSEVEGLEAPGGAIFDVDATANGYTAVGHVQRGRGRRARSEPTAWTSSDGLMWTPVRIADRDATAVDVATLEDGRSAALLFEPERTRRRRGRVVQTAPPSLRIATSSDGASWQVTEGPSLVADLGQIESWSLDGAGGRFLLRVDARPEAGPGALDGYLASDDGMTWASIPDLVGIDGSVAALDDGAVAVGGGTVHRSEDGTTWRSTYEEALDGHWLGSVAALADGQVLATGLTRFPDGEAVLFRGTPAVEAVAQSADCLDPAIHAMLTGDPESLTTLPAAEREQAAAAIAALRLTDEAAGRTLAGLVRDLRQGEAFDPMSLMGIVSGQTEIPACT
jgi:hypothetical protein